ncbi:MAG: ankyrin repeat domain-containing protein [Rickettsiales bacterium]
MKETLLHTTVKEGRTESVVELLSKKQDLDINAVDQDGNTPLHYAVMNNNLQIVDILLQATADPFIKNNKGEDPLSLADSTRNEEIVKLLNEARQPINDEASQQYYNMIKRIADAGKLNEKDDNHHTLLYREVEEGNINDVKIILSFGADTEITDEFGMTPLHRAASKCDCEMIRLLLKHNANILAKTLRGSTPFKLAQAKQGDPTCQDSYQKATEILKDAEDKLGPQKVASAQAERDAKDEAKRDAKDEAKRAARAEKAARAQAERAARAESQRVKATIYFVSTYRRDEFCEKYDISQKLLHNYYDCKSKKSQATAPAINRAAEEGNIDYIRNYLNAGGNPNSQDHNKNTLLHQAAAFSHPSIVELLLHHGADPSIKNKADEDPLFYANTIENQEIVKLLNQAQIENQAQSEENDQIMEELLLLEENDQIMEELLLLMEKHPPNSTEKEATLGKRTSDQRSTNQKQPVKGPHTKQLKKEQEQKEKQNNKYPFFEI